MDKGGAEGGPAAEPPSGSTPGRCHAAECPSTATTDLDCRQLGTELCL